MQPLILLTVLRSKTVGRQSLSEELSTVSGVACITILPVVKGWSIVVDFSDISPFGKSSFEPYFAEQILKEAIMLRCKVDGEFQLKFPIHFASEHDCFLQYLLGEVGFKTTLAKR